jgi:hypothetical protein
MVRHKYIFCQAVMAIANSFFKCRARIGHQVLKETEIIKRETMRIETLDEAKKELAEITAAFSTWLNSASHLRLPPAILITVTRDNDLNLACCGTKLQMAEMLVAALAQTLNAEPGSGDEPPH